MIVHLCRSEKFIPDFYKFCEENFENFHNKHYFFIRGKSQFNQISSGNVYHSKGTKPFLNTIKLIILMMKADKIIIHGLFDFRVILILALNRKFLEKSYLFCWGAEIYQFINKETRQVIKQKMKKIITLYVLRRIKYFVTHIKNDYKLAKSKLKISGSFIRCNLYPSNIVEDECIHFPEPAIVDGVRILVGNSADPTNNHSEVFDRLKKLQNKNFTVYCPLSYGDEKYKNEVIKQGHSLFGNRFKPMLNFLSSTEYRKFLCSIDIAIFNHNRQQALGNILCLLAWGKKVYVRESTSTWYDLSDLGIKLFALDTLSLKPIDEWDAVNNNNVIQTHYSLDKLLQQLRFIFGE